jgi:DNA repair ATPase RecN
VRQQLRQIDERLDSLEQHYANLKGVTKEIDDIRTEVQAIQQHLGIERKIAA